MKNDEKIDINLSSEVTESDLSQEEYFQLNYDTALRYINIAEHMKQFEDQDKYYHRAVQYLKKINDDKRFSSKINQLRRLKFTARVEGKIKLYEEACHIRDHAKTPQDYYSAQTIFLRIHQYEQGHPIPEKWVSAENYEKSLHCLDSQEQADYCEQKALEVEAAMKRSSLFASLAFIAIIIGLLAFSRTVMFHHFLGATYNAVGDYEDSYRHYLTAYERSGDESALESYKATRYKAAEKQLKNEDTRVKGYDSLKALAEYDYKDSQERFTELQIENLRTAEIGDKVHFSSIDWCVLEKTDDKIFLLKENALGTIPLNLKSENITWETSYARSWLNKEFLEEEFYAPEIEKILDTEVVTKENSYFKGVNPGNPTVDKLFLLSLEELEKYADIFRGTKSCWWLRTPGARKGTMAFSYIDKTPMPEGYDVGNQSFKIKPAMWVSLK